MYKKYVHKFRWILFLQSRVILSEICVKKAAENFRDLNNDNPMNDNPINIKISWQLVKLEDLSGQRNKEILRQKTDNLNSRLALSGLITLTKS